MFGIMSLQEEEMPLLLFGTFLKWGKIILHQRKNKSTYQEISWNWQKQSRMME